MHYFLVLFLLLQGLCFADDPFLPSAPPERSFSPGEELIAGLVSPRTGQLALHSIDLVAESVEPLRLTRYYYPPILESKYGKHRKDDEIGLAMALTRKFGWIFFPHTIATSNGVHISITEPDGSHLLFKRHKNGEISRESTGPFTNSDGKIINSTYDARNTSISFDGGKIVVRSKDGVIRYYERYKDHTFHLKKEKLQNGRWVVYSYDENILTSVESKDPHERHTYAKLSRENNSWTTHTGQKAEYQFDVRSKEGDWIQWWPPGYFKFNHHFFFLKHVISPLVDDEFEHTSRGLLHYCYNKFSSTYPPLPGVMKIHSVELPVGSKEENIPTHAISYDGDTTVVTHPDHTQTTYRYTSLGFPLSIKHEKKVSYYEWGGNGHLTGIGVKKLYHKEYESDSMGNPIRETFIGEDTYTIRRTYQGSLLMTEEGDAVTTYTYLPGTNLITSKITDGREEHYTYDDDNNLIQTVTDERTTDYILRQEHPHLHKIDWIEKEDGRIHLFYDQHGNISQEDHYDDDLFLYSIYREYNPRGNVVSETNALGQKFLYTYDHEGRMTSSSKPYQKMEYDKRGRLKKFSDALYTTTYKYDKADNLIEKTDRFGTTYYTYQDKHLIKTIHGNRVTESSYDIYGREISKTDGNGHTTYYSYNARNQPLKIDYPDNTSESYSYYPNGLLKEHTDLDGNRIRYEYDSFGRVTSKIYEGIGEETYTYDPYRLLSWTDLEGYRTEYTYDELGRKIREERCNRVIEYAYDSLSRLAHMNKGGITTTYTYDFLDRIIEESTPYSKTRYTYDEDGNQSSITNGDSTETFTYDPLKRLIAHTDPLGNTTTIEYQGLQKITRDPKGTVTIETYDIYENLISKVIPNIQTFRYTYDLAGNLIRQEEEVYKQGTLLKTLITEYSYTPTNKLASVNRDGEITTYLYDRASKTKIKPDGTSIEYTYDRLGNILSNGSDTFEYNKLGHLIKGTGFVRNIDPFGNVLQETFSNGLSITKTYDDLDRPLTMKLPTGTVFYTYDLRLKSISYKDYTHEYSYNQAGHLLKSGPTTYTRDAQGQILKIKAPHLSQECHYDPLGNLTFATPNSYSYDELSQLGGEFDSHYDPPDAPLTGNLSIANGLSLIYDDHDRLIQAGTTHFTYDALGRRLSKGDELYLYDGLEEIGTTTTLKIANVLLDLHGTLAIPLFDATHTLRYLVDPKTHTIINSYEFDPFGIPIYIFESIENPYRYAFKHHDKETNLIYFGKRYYNPTTNRWATPDPLGPIDVVNLYTFVRNNPFRFTDYTGLYSVPYQQFELNHNIDHTKYPYSHAIALSEQKADRVKSIYAGNFNRIDKCLIYIHGINSPISRTEHAIQTISEYAGDTKTIGIYNPSNGGACDLFEYSVRARPIYMPLSPVERHLFGTLTVEHAYRPPSAKFFLCGYSGGTTEIRNTLYFSPSIIRNRLYTVALGPSAIIDGQLCYRAYNYASTNDLVALLATVMTPKLKPQLIYLNPHPSSNKWNDHNWDSQTYQPQLKDNVEEYMNRKN